MNYWKKEYPTIRATTAVSFTKNAYTSAAIDPAKKEYISMVGNYEWCEEHYTTERGWTEIQKGEFLLIVSKIITS